MQLLSMTPSTPTHLGVIATLKNSRFYLTPRPTILSRIAVYLFLPQIWYFYYTPPEICQAFFGAIYTYSVVLQHLFVSSLCIF